MNLHYRVCMVPTLKRMIQFTSWYITYLNYATIIYLILRVSLPLKFSNKFYMHFSFPSAVPGLPHTSPISSLYNNHNNNWWEISSSVDYLKISQLSSDSNIRRMCVERPDITLSEFQTTKSYLRLEDLTATNMKMAHFWIVASVNF